MAALLAAAGSIAGTVQTVWAKGQSAGESRVIRQEAGLVNGITVVLVIALAAMIIGFIMWKRQWSKKGEKE